MKLFSLETFVFFGMVYLLALTSFSEASVGKMLLKWLIKKRGDIVLIPLPMPYLSQYSNPGIQEASFAWHRREMAPWSQDYYPPVPPPYPDDYMYPYP